MATIKDIAKMAGVSMGTVSNVLNGRDNVSVEKIKLVRQAAQQLGYSINLQAKQLRSDPTGTSTIALILPTVAEQIYAQFFEVVRDYFERQQKSVYLFTTGDLPQVEQNIVDNISAMRVAGVISVTCHRDVRQSYRQLIQSGAQVLFAVRSPIGGEDCIIFDYYQVGQDLAKRALSLGVRSLGVLCSPGRFSTEESFEAGLYDTFSQLCTQQNKSAPEVMIKKSTLPSAGKLIAKAFAENSAPELIFCTSSEYVEQVCFAMEATATKQRPYLASLSNYSIYRPTSSIVWYDLECGKLAEQAAKWLDYKIMVARGELSCDESYTHRSVLPPLGFASDQVAVPTAHKSRIRVLLMKGQSSEALTALAGRFTEQTNIEVDFTVLPPEEIYRKCMFIDQDHTFDVVRSSVSLLPILPKHAFHPFQAEDFRRITSGMAPMLINPLSLIDGEPYAIPFDVGSQVLVYRKDIFTDPMVKRMYFEQYGQDLTIPANFNDFNQVASFFNQKNNPSSPVRYGSSTSIGMDSEAFLGFILRYRALQQNPQDLCTLSPIDAAIATQVFEQYKKFYQNACVVHKKDWFGTAHNNFISGNSVMEIIAFNYASDIANLHTLSSNSQIGYAMVPGGCPVLGGGSMLITKNCKNYQAALQFVEWACGQGTAELFTYMGGTSPHLHVYQNQEILTLYPWYRLFEETFARSSYRELWDIFHVYHLEKMISNAMRSVVSGQMSSQEASYFIEAQLPNCRLPQ